MQLFHTLFRLWGCEGIMLHSIFFSRAGLWRVKRIWANGLSRRPSHEALRGCPSFLHWPQLLLASSSGLFPGVVCCLSPSPFWACQALRPLLPLLLSSQPVKLPASVVPSQSCLPSKSLLEQAWRQDDPLPNSDSKPAADWEEEWWPTVVEGRKQRDRQNLQRPWIFSSAVIFRTAKMH